MNRDDLTRVDEILVAAHRIAVVVARGRARFLADWEQQDVARCELMVVGEAARNLSNEFRDDHPALPIKAVIGQRDVLIHRYWDINYPRLWDTMTDHLPRFAAALQEIVADLSAGRQPGAKGRGAPAANDAARPAAAQRAPVAPPALSAVACGKIMPRAKKPCVLPRGHAGAHRSVRPW